MLIKVCGLNNPKNILELSQQKIDLMGFIFYKQSPRYFNNELGHQVAKQIPKRIKKVGVFVNESILNVLNEVTRFDLNYVQVHGDESPEYCEKLRSHVKIIKTISVENKNSISKSQDFSQVCDYFLFDTATSNYGGSGLKFDWSWLNSDIITKPFFISGGISLENCHEIKNLHLNNFIGIDVNSKFEISPGIKNLKKIKLLAQQIHDNIN